MPDRCIRLTRIHAIQWFGYCDTFDIHGNLLIAGRTGAGKSVLMDLLQLVLVGGQRAHFNAASDGQGHKSGRDKKSYCLCDTQEDINGVAQYSRDGGTTYVALEFSWPDEEKVETWGMRIEYANAEAQNPEEEFFIIPERLERSDFISPDRYALAIEGFRLLVKKKDGETFRNVTEYRKRMAEHLNFHRDTVDFLLPSAMSFSFLPRFDDFCRKYILQADDIKIEPVQQSYRSYLRIREELHKLQDKAHRLQSAVKVYDEYIGILRDLTVCRFLTAEFARDAASFALKEISDKISDITEQQKELQARADQLRSDLESKGRDLEFLKNTFRDKGGSLLLDLKTQIKDAVELIGRLSDIGKTVEEEKDRRVRRTNEFLKQAEAFVQERTGGSVPELALALRQFQDSKLEGLPGALVQLCAAIRTTALKVRSAVSKESEAYQRVKGELDGLQNQLRALEFNRVEESPLLDELNRRLERRGKENPARQLRELCEVLDEEWRPAIELAFTRKFAVVVAADQYPEALRLYQKEFKQDSLKESLVNPERALSRTINVHPQSLATKLECSHPTAQAVIQDMFGQVICVSSIDELRQNNDSIMSDGFRLRGMFAERPRRYDNRPCVGAKGMERLKANLLAKAEECSASLRGIAPLLTRSEQIQGLISEHRLESESIEADVHSAKALKDAEANRDRLIARNTAASTPELEKQLATITKMENELQLLTGEHLNLMLKLQPRELTELKQKRDDIQRAAEQAEEHYRETLVETGEKLNITRCEEIRHYFKTAFPKESVRENEAKLRYRDLTGQLPGKENELTLIRQGLVDQHADLRTEPDFDPQTPWNASYEKLLSRIKVDDMPRRQKEALEEEQRWQDLFRATVASRLSNAIRDVRSTINNINLPLKKPIGDSQYTIQVEDNMSKDYVEYRRVLEACSVTQEGQSIFASLEADAREGVEKVFQALVSEPDGKLAQAFLDYRSYFKYDMWVRDPKHPELAAKSLNRHSDKFSGGEKQTPFYISILACYLRAYKRHLPQRSTGPSIGLVPIDEAFSKMSGERITDAIRALRDVELQGILSMSSGNWPYAIGECDQVLAIYQKEQSIDGRKDIRNIGALLSRSEALERSKDWE